MNSPLLALPFSRGEAAIRGTPAAKETDVKCPIPDPPTGLSRALLAARQAYVMLPAMETCSISAGVLNAEREALLPLYYNGEIKPGSQQDKIMRDYDRACLTREVQMFGTDVSTAEEREIIDRLAILVTDGDVPFCHGFRIGSHVVTARHCMIGDNFSWPQSSRVRIMGTSGSFAAEQAALSNAGVDPNTHTNLDFTVLRLADFASPNEDVSAWLGTARQGERLLLPQSNLYKRYAMGLTDASTLAASITIQNNPVCYARSVTPAGYIFHPCQSEQGTSGAPLLQRDASGAIRLVGVHAGATRRAVGPHGACQGVVPNHGVQIPVAEIASLGR